MLMSTQCIKTKFGAICEQSVYELIQLNWVLMQTKPLYIKISVIFLSENVSHSVVSDSFATP